jgi:multidrug resistance efflux pump
MRGALSVDLSQCTEFRQALQARPPRLAHGAAFLAAVLLGTALVWSALTRADLVVRVPGRVRPLSSPLKVVSAARGEVFSGGSGARVVEVNFRQGDEVRAGDGLLRLDTERLDHEIARRRRTLEAGEQELKDGARLEALLARQFAAARAKAEAERAQASAEVGQARERQAVDVPLAEGELADAENDEARTAGLVRRGAGSTDDQVKAAARVRDARAKLAKARLPVDDTRPEVLRRGLTLLAEDYALKREELRSKQGVRRGELEAARIELAGLEQEREQAVVRAPVGGVVTTGEVHVGDVLEAGKVVAEIAGPKGLQFEVAVPTEEAAHVRVGMPVRISLDAYDYQKYGRLAGTVSFVAPDSGVREGQRGAFYVVKVALEGEEVGRGGLRGQVKLGMAGQAEIVNGQESLLGLLLQKVRQTISLR